MKKLFIISALLGAMFFTSCEDFLDVNYTKDSPITTSVDQVLPVATFYAAQICYDHAEYGVYMCQALTTGGKSATGSYPYSQGWEFLGVNRHPMWRRHFYDLGANIQKMNELAEKAGQYNAILIGRTVMLMSTMMTTDAFGDMPRSQVYQSASPKYDTQAEVYEWMFQEVDELLKLYKDPAWVKAKTNLLINDKMDRIYGGDIAKWEAFCKALKARLWLRKLPNWENNPAVCQEIIRLVDDALANWEEPQYHYPGGVTESNCPWGPYAPKINSWESRDNRLASSIPTKFFLKGILGAIDGTWGMKRGYAIDLRATQIMEQPTAEKNNALGYLESNIGMSIDKTTANYPDLYAASKLSNPYTQNTGYIALITTEELKFIKAEAQYWAGDNAGAYNTTVEATKDNMVRYNLPVVQLDWALELLNSNPKADSILVAQGISKNQVLQYKRFLEVKLPGADKFTIADLMQQKYVAMYLQPEQWTDMRRYNYSSSTNGISYSRPGQAAIYVYDVANIPNGATKEEIDNETVEFFDQPYSLRRPYNLYAPYWIDDPDNFGVNAELSPNAWVARLNADTETETKYNKKELDRMGYYTTNAAGEKILDYRILKKRMIWAYNTSGMAHSSDPGIKWQ